MGHLLLFLKYSSKLYEHLGFDGTVEVRIRLERVRGKQWLYPAGGFLEQRSASELDDDISFELDFSTGRLNAQLNSVAADLTRAILFALNWPEVATDETRLKQFFRYGYEYNSWDVPADL